jgi:hypothetical protein
MRIHPAAATGSPAAPAPPDPTAALAPGIAPARPATHHHAIADDTPAP